MTSSISSFNSKNVVPAAPLESGNSASVVAPVPIHDNQGDHQDVIVNVGGRVRPTRTQKTPNDNHSGNQTVIVNASQHMGPDWFVRLMYFVFVGWWLSGLCIVLSYALMATVIGIPVGVAVLNRLPHLTSLRPRSQTMQVTSTGGTLGVNFQQGAPQRNWLVRAVYFILVGWWLVAAYLILAWVGTVLTLGWGALVFYNPVPALLTLHRN